MQNICLKADISTSMQLVSAGKAVLGYASKSLLGIPITGKKREHAKNSSIQPGIFALVLWAAFT